MVLCVCVYVLFSACVRACALGMVCVCMCKIVWYCIVYIREQEPSEGVQEDDIDDKDEEEFEPKGNSCRYLCSTAQTLE